MNDELKALYSASLREECHSVFYRRPFERAIHGVISNLLSDPSIDSEGFIISSFDYHLKPKLIQNHIEFRIEDLLYISYNIQSKFIETFQNNFNAFLNIPEPIVNPFFNSHPIHCASQVEFTDNVRNAINKIEKGFFTKVVLSRAARYNYSGSSQPIDIFNSVSKAYPEAFISMISSPFYGTWIGASPEILLEQSHENYTTVAIAGTKKANPDTTFTSKEFEEQNIIKEYIENYLNSNEIVSKSSEIHDIKAGSLMHLKTNIAFTHSALDRMKILQDLHPTPAVGGYPKDKAVQYISETENYSREVYAGYIGPISIPEMHIYVNLRCMQWLPGYAVIYAGAGITGASDAGDEWLETENKMQIIASALALI